MATRGAIAEIDASAQDRLTAAVARLAARLGIDPPAEPLPVRQPELARARERERMAGLLEAVEAALPAEPAPAKGKKEGPSLQPVPPKAPAKGVSNITAAYKLAVADELIDAKGNIDWDTLQKSYPELFAKPQPPTPPNINGGDKGKQTDKQQLDDATKLAAQKFGIRIPTA